MRHEAIRLVYPNAELINGESEAWDSNGNVIEIDESLVVVQETKLKAEYDAQEYARSRQKEYPTIEECVHAILDNDNNELDTLQAKRAEIKLKYPKGG